MYTMRPLRNFKTNQCCHLISRIANRAFFLNDEEKMSFVERLWRVASEPTPSTRTRRIRNMNGAPSKAR